MQEGIQVLDDLRLNFSPEGLFILNFTLAFETINKNITKNGISIPICFPKNISGLII